MLKIRSVEAIITLCLIMLFSASSVEASGNMKLIDLGSGWLGLATQSDPFDTSKYTIIQIKKDTFTFQCNECNFSPMSSGYDAFSFDAEIKYMVDDQSPVDKKGRYSTYLGGSDIVTDERYFSFRLTNKDIESFKKGNAVKVAGKWGDGWETGSVSLIGFTSAYDQMCK